MITLKLIPLATSALLSTFNPNSPETVVSLSDAIKSNAISAEYVATGQYSGKSVTVKLQNKRSKPIKIVIEQGLVFSPNLSRAQDLIVPKGTILALDDSETKSFTVDGYCIEAYDAAPAVGSGFKPYKTKNKELLELFNYFEKTPVFFRYRKVLQNAIWTVSDHKSLAYLHRNNKE